MSQRRFSVAHLFGIGAQADAGGDEDPNKKPKDEAGKDGETAEDPANKPKDEAGKEGEGSDADEAAATAAATAAAVATARAEGARAERERIGAILSCKAAAGRGDAALHLAMNTDMPAAQAETLLGTMPKQSAKGLAGMMAEFAPNPQIGAQGAGPGTKDGGDDEATKLAVSILAAGRQARGEKA